MINSDELWCAFSSMCKFVCMSAVSCDQLIAFLWEPIVSVAHQDSGTEAGSSSDGDLQPGEKVLQDIREWNGLERRLQAIQQQLETLSWSQELTVSSKRLCSLAHKPRQKNPIIRTWPVLCDIRLHPDPHTHAWQMLTRALSLILSEAAGHKLTCSTAETHAFLPLSSFTCIAFGNNWVILSFNGQTCKDIFSSAWPHGFHLRDVKHFTVGFFSLCFPAIPARTDFEAVLPFFLSKMMPSPDVKKIPRI